MGGNGGVHAGDLAETLGIVRVVVPPAAGLFSALGLLAADVEHQSIRAFYRALAEVRPEDMAGTIGPMIEEVEALLARSGFGTAGSRSIEVLLELKYAGQGSTLSLHVPHERLHAEAVAALSGDFDAEHLRQYGYHSPREPKRCVAIKVVGRGLAATPPPAPPHPAAAPGPDGRRRRGARCISATRHGWLDTLIITRDDLTGEPLPAPPWVDGRRHAHRRPPRLARSGSTTAPHDPRTDRTRRVGQREPSLGPNAVDPVRREALPQRANRRVRGQHDRDRGADLALRRS
jgi:N-methylhydantoinase A